MTEPILPCGRDPLAVEDHATAGTLDDHERSCPYCGRVVAAAELSARLAGEAAVTGDVEPPADLVPRAMRSVRTELRHARELPVPSPDGAAFVTDHVVTTVLRDHLDAAGGLTVSSCRIDLAADAGARVHLEAYAHYRQDLRAEAEAARLLVTRVLRREFGLTAEGGVDVDVVDLIGPVA